MSEDVDVIRETTEELLELAAQLLIAQGEAARAKLIAGALVNQLSDAACIVYRVQPDNATEWRVIGKAGPISSVPGNSAAVSRLTQSLLNRPLERLLYNARDLHHGDLVHLQAGSSVVSIAYIPIASSSQKEVSLAGVLAGVVEIVTFTRSLSPSDLKDLEPMLRLGVPALLGSDNFERQRRDLMDSIHRMTQLYDLEKSLNATLELDHVIAMVPQKTLPMIGCETIHLWLFDREVLTLMSSDGPDPTVHVGMRQLPGEGYVADMAEEGLPLLISDAMDERLQQRNRGLSPGVRTALVVSLMQDDAEVGVLEAINRKDGRPFDEDDEFFLTSVAETVSNALKNASLLYAERKLAILEVLVHVSSQITSTLRLDRLLQIIVNSPQSVLPFERCVAVLDNRGKLQVRAISGMSSIPIGDAQVEDVKELVRNVPWGREPLYLRQYGAEHDDLPLEVARHFAATGYRGLYAMPLNDDQGRLGLLVYESSDPDFLGVPHTEMIKILAGQASVAIRNALLYREVPLISMLEPLMQRKQILLRTNRGRLWGIAATACLGILFFMFCPLPLRVSGEATVAPQHLVTIAAPVDGVVASVFAQEGQRVVENQVIGAMNDWQWRIEVNAAEARYRTAVLTMQADLARGAAQSGADRAQAEYLQTELDRARTRLHDTQLRSPIAGIVVTPELENVAGKRLDAGVAFAQVLDLSSAVVAIAIPQRDAELLVPGQSVSIKLDSFPQRSWHGTVSLVSPQAQAVYGTRTFVARVPLGNADASLRSGMTGRAKVFIGYKSAGYVLLRKPALWIWQTIWSWVGW